MTPHHPRFDFARLREQVSMAQVLAAYKLDAGLRRRGGHLVGPCPAHGGDNPTACRVHLERGLRRCFTARGGGHVVDLVRVVESCSFAQAARNLARMADGPQLPTREVERPLLPPFRPFTQRILLDPRTPFLQARKRITVETARRFEAGIAEPSTLLHATVGVRLRDLAGRPLGYCGRRLEPGDLERWGKWRFPSGFPKREVLYNAHRAQAIRSSGMVVVESPWAVMRLHQAGVPGAVALLGTTLTDAHLAWLTQAREVLLLLDGDEPGRRASRAIANRLHRSALRARL